METQNLTLKQIVIQHPESVALLEKYGLDFCCRGKRTLEEACNEKGLNYSVVDEELLYLFEQLNGDDKTTDFNKMELDELINHIISVHHHYVKESLPLISGHTQKVARVHGERYPENIEIAKYFDKVKCELEQHMMKEERILFPYINMLVQSRKNGTPVLPPSFGTIVNPVKMMEMEHELAGDGMEQIRKYSNNFTPPSNACTTYRVSYMELDRFERDLHQHVHLENNILFPKAVELEKSKLAANANLPCGCP